MFSKGEQVLSLIPSLGWVPTVVEEAFPEEVQVLFGDEFHSVEVDRVISLNGKINT